MHAEGYVNLPISGGLETKSAWMRHRRFAYLADGAVFRGIVLRDVRVGEQSGKRVRVTQLRGWS